MLPTQWYLLTYHYFTTPGMAFKMLMKRGGKDDKSKEILVRRRSLLGLVLGAEVSNFQKMGVRPVCGPLVDISRNLPVAPQA